MCMSYLSAQHARSLTKYEMVKLHVLVDFYHTIESGTPMIGGPIQAWKDGPVINPAYMRLESFRKTLIETGIQPEEYVIDTSVKYARFRSTLRVDQDDFSELECRAMQKAWDYLMPTLDSFRGFRKVEKLFHETSFIGKAWAKARANQRAEIDWNDLIDAFDLEANEKHSENKALMQM